MIFADIQTTINLTLMVLALSVYFAAYAGFHVLRNLGRTLNKSYEEGGGNRKLLKNVATKGAGHILKRLFVKLILKR
jgi:hypothetical protein